ncbi:hypothetical protein ACFQ1L_26390 [Phytohabitans flavus]|uniref:hypothetical protein n=1 Tax=Phytohabitans flavus TaxID=1076124 RepID=UPI00363B7A38
MRAVVDTPEHPLWRFGTPARGVRALRALRRAVPALQQWAAATGYRELRVADQPSFDGADLVLVAGRASSPETRRLVAAALHDRLPVHLVDDVRRVDLRWLAGARRVDITAAASAPPGLVDDLIRCLSGLGPVTVRFTLSREVI